jgi:3-phytase
MAMLWLTFSAKGQQAQEPAKHVIPLYFTEPVSVDADDPSIWVNPKDLTESLLICTNKAAHPKGALVVYDLGGKTLQTFDGIDRPDNVDVAYGLRVGSRLIDIAVVTERYKKQLRVFEIDPRARRLRDISAKGGIPVFTGAVPAGGNAEDEAPMGIGLYKRPRDGAIFAIVSRKHGPKTGYLWEYRLFDDGQGRVRGETIREFGNFSGSKEIEAVAVDNELGYVYYADEDTGIRKWPADPDDPDADKELAIFGGTGVFAGDREGIAIYKREDETGYIICTDQIPAHARYYVYSREGTKSNPHDHSHMLFAFKGGLDSTDGIEVVSTPLGAKLPHGIFVAMNSKDKNFAVFSNDQFLTPM